MAGVETFCRLVQHQKVGPVQNRLCQPDPLAESLRKLPDRPVVHVFDTRSSHGIVNRACGVSTSHISQPRYEHQVVEDQHIGVQRIVFRQVADTTFGSHGIIAQRDAVQAYLAFVWIVELGDHAHRRRLAGPVRPEESHDLPPINVERHTIDRRDIVKFLRNTVE